MPTELIQRKLWNACMSKVLRYCSSSARSYIEAQVRYNLSLINDWEKNNV